VEILKKIFQRLHHLKIPVFKQSGKISWVCGIVTMNMNSGVILAPSNGKPYNKSVMEVTSKCTSLASKCHVCHNFNVIEHPQHITFEQQQQQQSLLLVHKHQQFVHQSLFSTAHPAIPSGPQVVPVEAAHIAARDLSDVKMYHPFGYSLLQFPLVSVPSH
jgi:hypothetical protein